LSHVRGHADVAYDDEGQASNRLKFVSQERRLVPRPPFYRPPIYFPNVRLQMMKLSDEQLRQVRETGWTREVAFKTAPGVTKLEIKGVLEAMYGMHVERVHTINYLGRKHVTLEGTKGSKQPRRKVWRGDDWKKAYVLFHPPPGVQQLQQQQQLPRRKGMVEELLEAKGLVPPLLGPSGAPAAAAP